MNSGMNISNLHGNGAGQKQAGKALKALAPSSEDNVPSALSGDVNSTMAATTVPGTGLSPFLKIYNEIAQSNKIAQSNNGAKNGTELSATAASDTQTPDQDAAALGQELMKLLGLSGASQSVDLQQILSGNAANSSGTMSAEAATLIRDAIAAITKTLNLKVQDGLENLSSMTPTKGIIDQFAEMLSTLKGIAGVLDDSVKLNQPLEYKNLAFDVPTAANVQQVLREQIFKIEIGLKMMGISGDVSAAVAQKDDAVQAAVATLSGIPQASDPSKLAMPAIHVKQVLGEMLMSREQKVETLLTRLADTLKKNGVPEASATALLAKIAGTAGTQGPTAAAKAAASDMKDIGPLDSQVLRKILKVDAAQATASENKNAAQQNIALGLPKENKIATSKTFAEAIAGQKPTDTSTQAIPGNQGPQVQASDKLMSALRTNEVGTTRQLEESVITQVAEKLNVALKTGITEIRVLLHPDSLGDVQLKIKVEGDVVTGKMYVENQQVKHIVEANLQTLKDSLNQHNLSVGSFSVDVNHGNGTSGQMRDLADRGSENGNGNSNSNGGREGTNETENLDGSSKTLVSGIDTGRKFGTNTIEYFA